MASVQIDRSFYRWTEQASDRELSVKLAEVEARMPALSIYPDVAAQGRKMIDIIKVEIRARNEQARAQRMTPEQRLALVQSHR